MKLPLFRILAFLRRQRLRRMVLVVLAALLISSAIVWLVRGGGRVEPAYMTSVVALADVERSVLASGVLQPIHKVDVGAQVSGQLKRLHVRLGQTVSRGDLLAEIDPQLAQTDLQIAQAELDATQAEYRGVAAKLVEAREEWGRQQSLSRAGISSLRELQRALAERRRLESDLAGVSARVAKGRYSVEQQRTRLAYTRIAAPIDGQVLSIDTREGQTVIAAQQAPTILKLGDLSRIEVRAQVSEADIGRIRSGMPAFFTLLDASGVRYRGTVREIQPTPEKLNNAMFFNVLFDVDNPKRLLRPDMTAQVTLIERSVRQVPTVLLTALDDEIGNGFYRVRVQTASDRIETRKVRIGLIGRTHAQVLQGLTPGERVIIAVPESGSSAFGSGA
jgi:membrane fusion protein, macrolide-specific efflux system